MKNIAEVSKILETLGSFYIFLNAKLVLQHIFSLWPPAKGPDALQVGFATLVLVFGGCQTRVNTDPQAAQMGDRQITCGR